MRNEKHKAVKDCRSCSLEGSHMILNCKLQLFSISVAVDFGARNVLLPISKKSSGNQQVLSITSRHPELSRMNTPQEPIDASSGYICRQLIAPVLSWNANVDGWLHEALQKLVQPDLNDLMPFSQA